MADCAKVLNHLCTTKQMKVVFCDDSVDQEPVVLSYDP